MPTVITRDLARDLSEDIKAALAAVASKHGVTLECGSVRYSAERFTAKLDGRPAGMESQEQQETREQRDRYQRNIGVLGLPPLDSEVTLSRVVYLIRGMKRAAKNNIVLERKKDGKVFVGPHTELPRQSVAPALSLTDFVSAVNTLQQAECARLNAAPGRVFGAAFHPYPEIMLKAYHAAGLTPQQTLDSIAAEAESELRAEARMS